MRNDFIKEGEETGRIKDIMMKIIIMDREL